MTSFLRSASAIDPRFRQSFIMTMDAAMILCAIPVSLLLSQSHLSFEPFSWAGLAVWISVALTSHLLFRLAGFYSTVWRFASTPDFFNIVSTCGVLSIALYFIAVTIRYFHPITGLNERQFIVFFLVSFTIISVPRLIYRYIREGAGWHLLTQLATQKPLKGAVFVGSMSDAHIIIRFMESNPGMEARVAGIMTTDDNGVVGSTLRGIPIIAKPPQLGAVLAEYAAGTDSIDVLILGRSSENALGEFAELVRVARRRNMRVVQFSGFSQFNGGGVPVLESVDMETILRRSTIAADVSLIESHIRGRRVLVTGGAGSIGRTMVKRCLQLGAESVLVADISEFAIFRLIDSLPAELAERLVPRIIDICDSQGLNEAAIAFQPDIIFHAAALKHVPLLEENWVAAIRTNVFGTLSCVEAAVACGARQFVLISSDKAADPTSILGLTKRAAEQIVNAFHFATQQEVSQARFASVRFGNVFGSDGSVATVFERQIREGQPVTITDPSMTRYMMTIGEAVDLVIMAAVDAQSHADKTSWGIYMLDMGEPVSILAVAETMIRLSGKKPHLDIPIVVTGVRAGEKLHETLTASGERVVEIDQANVFGVSTGHFEREEIDAALALLRDAMDARNKAAAGKVLKGLHRDVPELDTAPAQIAS